MAYTFEQIFAADPSSPERVAADGVVTIFAPGDTSQAPLSIMRVDGTPLENPIKVNDAGYGPAFMHATLGRVAWAGGGFSGFFTAHDSIKQEAVAAAASADQARIAAEKAVNEAQAPTDASVDRGIARADIPKQVAQQFAGAAFVTAVTNDFGTTFYMNGVAL